MKYLDFLDRPGVSIAPNYVDENTHLALSTVLTNFNSATIEGKWSSDNYSY